MGRKGKENFKAIQVVQRPLKCRAIRFEMVEAFGLCHRGTAKSRNAMEDNQ